MKKHIKTKRQLPVWSVCVIGVGMCLLLSVAGAALTGSLMLNEIIGQAMSSAVTKAFLFFAIFIGIITALNISEAPVIPTAAVVSGAVIILQLLICAFIYDGVNGNAFINSLIILTAAAFGVILKTKKRDKSKIIKKRYR